MNSSFKFGENLKKKIRKFFHQNLNFVIRNLEKFEYKVLQSIKFWNNKV